VDDAFAQAASAKKTIQLLADPGFQSPQWVLGQIPSGDGLFQSPVQSPPSTCGTATKSPGRYTTNPRVFSNLTTGKIITM
jgi:hypothetical protein